MAPERLRITEIFSSIQGESTWAGRRCTFVRLAGCDLRCRWCDSAYTFTGGEDTTIDEVLTAVTRLGNPLVEITGGEPMLQSATPLLAERLLAEGYEVLIETGGHKSLESLDPRVVKIVDVKCPGSGESHRNADMDLLALNERDELKFVLADRADFEWAAQSARKLARKHTVLFSPVWGELPPETLAEWILEEQLPVRLNLQQHKYLWGEERGR